MRKALMVTLIVALSLAAFVSCNSEMADSSQTGDKLVSVVLGDNPNAKGISVNTTHDQGAETYYWFYTAVKKDNSIYRTGETGADGWKAVKNGTGLVGADLGLFSKGQWEFSFRGYKDNPINQSTPNYNAGYTYFHHGLAVEVSDATATAMQNNSEDKAVYISVVLNHHADYETAEVIFPAGGDDDPYLNWKYSVGSNANTTQTIANIQTMNPVLVVYYSTSLDENTDNWIELARSSNFSVDTTDGADVSFTSFTPAKVVLPARAFEEDTNNQETVNSGIEYQLKFVVIGTSNNVEEILGTTTVGAVSTAPNNSTRSSVVAYSGGTIKLSRSSASPTGFEDAIEPNDSLIHVIIKDSVEVVTKSETVQVASNAVTNVSLAAAPDGNNNTSVSFPANSLGSASNVEVEVTVFDSTASGAKFEVTSGSTVVAALDFSATDKSNNGAITEFTAPVTITTFIGTGLTDVSVVYNGNGASPSDVNYDSSTGELSFKTTHFSEFVVTTGAEAFNINKGKAYSSLKDAIDEASADNTIVLLKGISLTATVNTEKSLTIDFNGHSITATNCRAIWVKEGVIELAGTGTISANGTSLSKDSSVIRVGDGDDTHPSNGSTAGLVIGQGVTVSSEKCYGVTIFGTETNGQSLVVNGNVTVTGQSPAISGNGNSWNAATTITIKDNADVSATNDYAIYHPQRGTLTVIGGSITGKGGIEAKGGNVVVNGGTITANATQTSHSKNNNGTSTSGYALAAVENNGYQGEGSITVTGGNIDGVIICVIDTDASFTTMLSVTGGSFSNDPTSYLASGYYANQVSDRWVVTNTSN